MEPISPGRYAYKGWELSFALKKLADEAGRSGLAQIQKGTEVACSLVLAGSFGSEAELVEALKARCVSWVDEREVTEALQERVHR